MDTVTSEIRSRIMGNVRQKNTNPEKVLRTALHNSGLRYRLHDRALPGTPDIVIRRYRAAIFVHGCFWHSHGCQRSTVPKSNRVFWESKFRANRDRDERNRLGLLERGWRVLVVWECSLTGKRALRLEDAVNEIREWLVGSIAELEISGRP